MTERIEPVPGVGKISPVERDIEIRRERAERDRETEEAGKADRLDISSEREIRESAKTEEKEEVSREEQERAAQDWYRYGLPQAYQSLG